MKSRTSFSKLTIFKKDISRFAPIWALYLIGTLLVLFGIGYGDYDKFAYHVMPSLVASFGIVNLIYAGVVAVMLFGDLYNTRMCYSLHTVPMRREGLLLSHTAAALCFSLVPNGVVALFLMTQLQNYWFLALYWLLAVTLQFLFFYGVAVLSAILTGNRFAMLLVYAGFNFVSILAYWVISFIYLPVMPGVILNMHPFTKLCPVVELFQWEFFQFRATSQINLEWGVTETFYQYLSLGSGWGYLAIMGGVGVVLTGVALVLYRLRQLESAGDFVAFPKLKNVACVIMTACVGGVFALVGDQMIGDSMLPWLIVGLVIGFFGSLMLLERRVKVFRWKTLLGFVMLAAVLFGSFGLMSVDAFGIVTWTPDAQQVESVVVSNFKDSEWEDEVLYGNRMRVTKTAQEDIEKIITAHQDILDRMYHPNENVYRVTFTYHLKDGRTVKRTYAAPKNGTNYEILSGLFNSPEQILGYDSGNQSWTSFVDGIDAIYFDGTMLHESYHRDMMDALRSDVVTGSVSGEWEADSLFYVEYVIEQKNGSYVSRNLMVSSRAEKTLALLSEPDILLGDPLSSQIIEITVVGHAPLEEQEQRKALEDALRQDAEETGSILLYDTGGSVAIWVEIGWDDGTYTYTTLYVSKDATNTLTWLKENVY